MSKNPQHLDFATPLFGSAQNDSIFRGFLNSGFDGLEATLKCFLLVILHEGHTCLKLEDPPCPRILSTWILRLRLRAPSRMTVF